MAAVELKKKNWKFNKKFVTWFKKADSDNGNLPATSAFNINRQTSAGQGSGMSASGVDQAPQKDVGKYVFFDFENGWQ